jgi:hypothetical protein
MEWVTFFIGLMIGMLLGDILRQTQASVATKTGLVTAVRDTLREAMTSISPGQSYHVGVTFHVDKDEMPGGDDGDDESDPSDPLVGMRQNFREN